MKSSLPAAWLAASVMAASLFNGPACHAGQPDKIQVVVMDPLAAPLACDCVQGYAQRKYEALGAYLQEELRQPVNVVWNESLANAIKETGAQPDIIIGKHSVVLHDCKQAKLPVLPVARLTGADGKVTQSGLVVVRKDDQAQSVEDLQGYRIFFGPESCAEKHAAPIALLKKAGIKLSATLDISSACSSAATSLIELPNDVHGAAIISSYAKPLLEGCGTINKGDLRIIGESRSVPFVSVFVRKKMPAEQRKAIVKALLDVELNGQLLVALESERGFVRWNRPKRKSNPTDKAVKPSTVKKKR